MGYVARRLRDRGAIPLGCALAALWVAPANAESGAHLFSADAFELSGDLRLVAVDGEKSWVDGGFGKLRSGSDGDLRVQPQLGNATLVWKPQFSWSLGAIVVGSLQGGERSQAGLSQAYLTFRPMRSNKVAFSARAGPMWPPVAGESARHQGPVPHPLCDVGEGFARRPGYCAKLAGQPPIPVRLELFRYDSRADPEAVNSDLEWGWRTAFNDVGLVADLGA